MKAAPRLTIGLPVRNGENYLAQSIEALLAQSYEDFELIISDNASTDGTAAICSRYASQDSRIRYIRQQRNIGISPNHNFVVEKARGEFFKWAASDDLYASDLIQKCIEALDEYPDVILAHSYTAAIDASGNVTQSLQYPLTTDSPNAAERFGSLLFGGSGLFRASDSRYYKADEDNDGVIRACDQYGVVRTEVIRHVAPLGSYHHADRIIVCEFALHGRFHITPDWLYFRRDHPERAYRVHQNLRARCASLDPRRASRLRHPTSRLLAEYIWGYAAAIGRAPLSSADRRACYRHLAKWTVMLSRTKVFPRRQRVSENRFPAVTTRSTIPDAADAIDQQEASQ